MNIGFLKITARGGISDIPLTPAERRPPDSRISPSQRPLERQKTERATPQRADDRSIGYCSDTSEADVRTHSSCRHLLRVQKPTKNIQLLKR